MAEPRRIFTATLVIGVSGAGKTSLLKTFAEYLWETYQKSLFLYSWDGGAIPTQIQTKMQQGLIRFWRVRSRSAEGLALETVYLATKGYLPKTINLQTGETPPAVEMVAPILTRYTATCPKGHVLKVAPSPSLLTPMLCPTCKQMVKREEMRVAEVAQQNKGFEPIGGVAFDGLSSMCQVVMEEMDRQRGHGLIGGEKSSFGGVVASGSLKFGGNNRADVGFAQSRANQFVNNALSIPNLKEGPVFTGLSTEGSDKSGLPALGLDLPGQAAFNQAPAWFGNICEAGTTVDENGKEHFTLYTRPFTDPQGRRHLLKTSASPLRADGSGVPDKLVDPPNGEGEAFSAFNLGLFFKLLDQDLKDSLTREPSTDMPGIPDGTVEYGEAFTVETPPAVSQTDTAAVPPQASPTPPARSVARPIARPKAASSVPQSTNVPPSTEPQPAAAGSPPPPGRPPMRAPGA